MVIPLIVGFAAALAPSRIFRPTVQVYGVNFIKKIPDSLLTDSGSFTLRSNSTPGMGLIAKESSRGQHSPIRCLHGISPTSKFAVDSGSTVPSGARNNLISPWLITAALSILTKISYTTPTARHATISGRATMPPTEVRRATIHLLLHATAYGTTQACCTNEGHLGS